MNQENSQNETKNETKEIAVESLETETVELDFESLDYVFSYGEARPR